MRVFVTTTLAIASAALPIGMLLLAHMATTYATDGHGLHPALAVVLAGAMCSFYTAGLILVLGSRR